MTWRSTLYVFVLSINATCWVLSALVVVLERIANLTVFAVLITLRYSQPGNPLVRCTG